MTKVVSRFFCCNNARSKYRGLYRPFISTVRYFNGRICLQEPVYNGKKRKNAYYDNYSENSINEWRVRLLVMNDGRSMLQMNLALMSYEVFVN